jgi:hypothetical protein
MMTVEWTSGSEPDLAGFTLEMNSTASMTQFKTVYQAGPIETSARIFGLSPGTTYGFRVRSFDLSDNHSPYSALLKGTTMPRLYTIRITVVYDGGPMDAQPASHATVRLINFNGTLLGTGIADATGGAVFGELGADESYMIEASPVESLKGIEGVLTGYLENASGFIETSGGGTTITVDLILPYYMRPVHGSVSVSVAYGTGPRSDAVYNALVDLMDSTGSTVESSSTDDLGMASFVIRALPSEGYFRVIPPASVAAIPGRKAGYLEAISDRFNVTGSSPNAGTLQVMLEYVSYELPPRPLLIIWKSPTGRGVNINAPIVVTFNQAVRTNSVEDHTSISPLPNGVDYTWSNNNQTVTIVHEGFMPDTVYRVTLARNVISAEDSSFPVGYANNTWEFRTGDDPAGSDLTKAMIYAIIALVVIILIGLGIFIYLKQRPKIDLEIEEDEPDPYSYDYPEEDTIEGSVEDEEEVEDTIEDTTDVDDREGPEESIDLEGSPEDEEIPEAEDDEIEMLEDDDDFPDEPGPEVTRTNLKPRLRVVKGA